MFASFINNGVERENVVDESILQILAESDTTATTIRVIMLYLGCIIEWIGSCKQKLTWLLP